MPHPNNFGMPCWTQEQVSKVISLTAQTSASSASYFLAAHSPFRQIIDGKSLGSTLNEEEVFKNVFSKARGQVQAFVRGEPGTGKSHLIRWLKERSEYAARQKADGLANFQLVIVTRGNGSLKDALGQIVQQLGRDFERHISRVQGAIDRLSDQTARATLLSELALELSTRWTNEHRRAPLEKRLRHLGDALNAPGIGRWLKRDGGVIHQVIRRLTEQSTAEDRENFPSFNLADLDIPPAYLSPAQNPGEAIQLADDMAEELETKELAVSALNTALADAVRALTGLKGDDLVKIFTEIRRQLGPKKSLGVFIEDVSVTGLDQDVINAFEPREADGLCRMVAILGITDNGWLRLPDNLRQRATHIYEVGGSTVTQWASDAVEVAKFTARYLNAVRSSDEDIAAAAEDRFEGNIRKSACDGCLSKSDCHQVFGKVDIGGGVEVGMFPFSAQAPQAMLQRLSEARYKSQRGLLDRVLLPALDQSRRLLLSHEFPRPQLFAIQSPPFPVWTGIENRYCNGPRWDDVQQARLRFLAQFWVSPGTAEELAASLKPFLKPLGLPEFSSTVGVRPPTGGAGRGGVVRPPIAPPTPPVVNEELNRLLALLEEWKSGRPLREDNKFRDLLGAFLGKSILWQDCRGVPIAEKKRLVVGNKFPRIEDQVMNPGGIFFFDLKRDVETYKFLQSLLLHSRSPDGGWGFEQGEVHKREMSRWLRKHQKKVVQSLQPDEKSVAQKCLRSAVEALALAALFRDRKNLPENRADRVAALFSSVWQTSAKPAVLSPEVDLIVSDLELKHSLLRDFVVQEVGVGQGEASPKDFIDPLPVLAVLEDFDVQMQFEPPPVEAETSFWKSRFQPVSTLRMGAFASIPARLESERSAMGNAIKAVREFVKDAGFDAEKLSQNMEACKVDLVEVIILQRGAQHQKPVLPLPNVEFDNLWQKKQIQVADARGAWVVAVGKAIEVSGAEGFAALLTFNPVRLKECVDALKIVRDHLDLVDQHMSDEEGAGGPEGDSRSKLLAVLKEIEGLAESKEEGESASA